MGRSSRESRTPGFVGVLFASDTNGSMGQPDGKARIALGAGPTHFGDLVAGVRPRPGHPITMDQALTPVSLWRIRAMAVLKRVMAAERRFSASISVNKITMLAAADELDAATRDATVWLTANPCPDAKLGVHVAEMLTTCAEVALVAQRAVTGPFAGSEGVMARLRDLLTVINFHSAVLDAW